MDSRCICIGNEILQCIFKTKVYMDQIKKDQVSSYDDSHQHRSSCICIIHLGFVTGVCFCRDFLTVLKSRPGALKFD